MLSSPETECLKGALVLGQDLLDKDASYYFGLMNFIMRSQPNLVAGKAVDDEEIKRLAISSAWRCGDRGRIAFVWYCQGGVTINPSGEPACNNPILNVP
jgi:hypothetical protein